MRSLMAPHNTTDYLIKNCSSPYYSDELDYITPSSIINTKDGEIYFLKRTDLNEDFNLSEEPSFMSTNNDKESINKIEEKVYEFLKES